MTTGAYLCTVFTCFLILSINVVITGGRHGEKSDGNSSASPKPYSSVSHTKKSFQPQQKIASKFLLPINTKTTSSSPTTKGIHTTTKGIGTTTTGIRTTTTGIRTTTTGIRTSTTGIHRPGKTSLRPGTTSQHLNDIFKGLSLKKDLSQDAQEERLNTSSQPELSTSTRIAYQEKEKEEDFSQLFKTSPENGEEMLPATNEPSSTTSTTSTTTPTMETTRESEEQKSTKTTTVKGQFIRLGKVNMNTAKSALKNLVDKLKSLLIHNPKKNVPDKTSTKKGLDDDASEDEGNESHARETRGVKRKRKKPLKHGHTESSDNSTKREHHKEKKTKSDQKKKSKKHTKEMHRKNKLDQSRKKADQKRKLDNLINIIMRINGLQPIQRTNTTEIYNTKEEEILPGWGTTGRSSDTKEEFVSSGTEEIKVDKKGHLKAKLKNPKTKDERKAIVETKNETEESAKGKSQKKDRKGKGKENNEKDQENEDSEDDGTSDYSLDTQEIIEKAKDVVEKLDASSD